MIKNFVIYTITIIIIMMMMMMKVKNDDHSKFSNLSNWKEEA